MNAPTVRELTQHSAVRAALERAWMDSDVNNAESRHEEGGWIYMDATGTITIRKASSGGHADLTLEDPPKIHDSFVVATFHTHPNSASEGWDTGPSSSDTESAHLLGVPCIIRAKDGIHTTGPDSRRGGLTGNPGFPE